MTDIHEFEEYLKYATKTIDEYAKYETVQDCSEELLGCIQSLIRAKDTIKFWKLRESKARNHLIYLLKENNIKEIATKDVRVKLSLSTKMTPTIFGVDIPKFNWRLNATGDVPTYGYSAKKQDAEGE